MINSELPKPSLPQELVLDIINLINCQWQNFDLKDIDRIQTSSSCVCFNLSKENEYFKLFLYNDIGNDSIIVEYKKLNEIVNDFEIKICLNSEMIQLINKDLINISKIFACDMSLLIVLEHSSNIRKVKIVMDFFLKLYKENRITVNSEFRVCIDSIDLVNKYTEEHSEDENSYPALLISDHICYLLLNEKGIKI